MGAGAALLVRVAEDSSRTDLTNQSGQTTSAPPSIRSRYVIICAQIRDRVPHLWVGTDNDVSIQPRHVLHSVVEPWFSSGSKPPAHRKHTACIRNLVFRFRFCIRTHIRLHSRGHDAFPRHSIFETCLSLSRLRPLLEGWKRCFAIWLLITRVREKKKKYTRMLCGSP